MAIRRFDDAILKTFAEVSRDIVAEAGSGDVLARKIYQSYLHYRASIRQWSDLAEGAYLGVRYLGL